MPRRAGRGSHMLLWFRSNEVEHRSVRLLPRERGRPSPHTSTKTGPSARQSKRCTVAAQQSVTLSPVGGPPGQRSPWRKLTDGRSETSGTDPAIDQLRGAGASTTPQEYLVQNTKGGRTDRQPVGKIVREATAQAARRSQPRRELRQARPQGPRTGRRALSARRGDRV